MLINIARSEERTAGLPFTTQPSHDAIDVFGMVPLDVTPSDIRAIP